MLSLPAPAPAAASEAMLERQTVYQAHAEPPDPEAASIAVCRTIFGSSTAINGSSLAFVTVVVASTIIVSSRMTPYYESTATIDVDRMMPTGVLGQDANGTRATVNDSDRSSFLPCVDSDPVRIPSSGPVVQQLKLPPKEIEHSEDALRPGSGCSRSSSPGSRLRRPPKTYLLQISYRSLIPSWPPRSPTLLRKAT